MAKKVQRKTSKLVKKKSVSPFNIYWDTKNYLLLFAGIASVIVGFLVMSFGNWDSTSALVFSPIILGIAYVIIFPLSIFSKSNNVKDNGEINQN